MGLDEMTDKPDYLCLESNCYNFHGVEEPGRHRCPVCREIAAARQRAKYIANRQEELKRKKITTVRRMRSKQYLSDPTNPDPSGYAISEPGW